MQTVKGGLVSRYELKAPGDRRNICAILNVRTGSWLIFGILQVESLFIRDEDQDNYLYTGGFYVKNHGATRSPWSDL